MRLYSGEALPFRTWGDGAVVFSPASGATYFLDSVATAAVFLLSPDWLGVSDYRVALAEKLGVDDDEILKRYVDRLIVQFEESGFLEVDLS